MTVNQSGITAKNDIVMVNQVGRMGKQTFNVIFILHLLLCHYLSFLCNLSFIFFIFFLEILTFHVMVNVLVKWKNYVDVPENENQFVESMGRRTVTSVWQNVSMYTG